ncbi:MAG: ankyrin repeat domain-containing protein [Gammaproteobacteria bacterium]|nr:ankyrin repeat domain-containing protein [Gammaproteobacteria bacterium]
MDDPLDPVEKRTALMVACINGHGKLAQLLVLGSCSPAAQDKNGNTPLHHAVMKSHSEFS